MRGETREWQRHCTCTPSRLVPSRRCGIGKRRVGRSACRNGAGRLALGPPHLPQLLRPLVVRHADTLGASSRLLHVRRFRLAAPVLVCCVRRPSSPPPGHDVPQRLRSASPDAPSRGHGTSQPARRSWYFRLFLPSESLTRGAAPPSPVCLASVAKKQASEAGREGAAANPTAPK
jgi:hypothetical protein